MLKDDYLGRYLLQEKVINKSEMRSLISLCCRIRLSGELLTFKRTRVKHKLRLHLLVEGKTAFKSKPLEGTECHCLKDFITSKFEGT